VTHFFGCIGCGRATGTRGVCTDCLFYDRAWCVGERHEVLRRLVDDFKFERMRSAYHPLAGLLSDILPLLPEDTVILPIPTVRRHIRQRGYDHTALIAKRLSKLKNCLYEPILERKTQSVQRGASRSERIQQAKEAFVVTKPISANTPYLIVDDVVTTGSTLKYAAKDLRDAGASQVWVAAIARQPSTK